MANSLTRRSFFEVSGLAAAGLGLTACGGGNGTQGGSGDTGVEPQDGSPATTALDKLPLPEKGKTYNNPKKRDDVKDDGTVTLAINEVGPNWNYVGLEGNTTYMNWLWSLYMPIGMVVTDATGSKYTANPDYIKSLSSDESSGKQVITVVYADQAKFNDGTDIDWKALETAWKCLSGQSSDYVVPGTDGYDKIETVTQGDTAKTAVITMREPVYPYEALVDRVLHPDFLDVDTFNSGFLNNPHVEYGAGPYIVDSFDDTHATFKPNPKWWGDAPKSTTITYKQMEAQATFNAFKNGEIDSVGTGLSGTAEMLSNFNSMEDAQIRRGLSTSIAVIEINSTRGALQDIAVRKAFCQAVDPATIVSIVFQGVNWQEEAPGSMLLPYWADGYEDNRPDDLKNLKDASARIAAAKKTLEDAGYKAGSDGIYAKGDTKVSFSFTTFGDSTSVKNRSAAIQKMAKDAGIEVDIDNHASSEFSKILSSGAWDTCLFGWNGTTTSIWNGVQLYGSESSSNFGKQGTADTDAEFAKVPSIKDKTEQFKQCNATEKKLMETYAYLPLFTGPDCSVVKKGLANYGPSLFESTPVTDLGWQKD